MYYQRLLISSALLQGCTVARRYAETFSKYVHRNMLAAGASSNVRDIEIHLNGMLSYE